MRHPTGDGSARMPAARSEQLVVSELGDELLVYDLLTKSVTCLDPRSAKLWAHLDGSQTLRDVADIFGTDDLDVARFALAQLAAAGLLAHEIPPEVGPAMSRRALAKKLMAGGLGLATIPVVVSVAVPAAAQTGSQTCVGFMAPVLSCFPGNTTDLSDDGCPCTANPECAGVCPVSNGPRYCVGGNTGPFCAPGNDFDGSIPCCPCTGNPECQGVCPVGPGTRVCVG
jgi:hypothetical protein